MSRERLDALIVVFDREGYSAELYRYLDGRDQGAGKRRGLFISWANYADKWVHDVAEEQLSQMARVSHQIQETEEIRYLETERTMSKYGISFPNQPTFSPALSASRRGAQLDCTTSLA